MTPARDIVEGSPPQDAGAKPPPGRRQKVAPENRTLLPWLWAILASGVIGLLFIPAGVVLVIAAVIFQGRLPSAVFLLFTAVGGLGMVMGQTARLRLLLRFGRWRGLDGRIHTRAEHPGRFRALVATHGLLTLIYLGVTSYLLFAAFGPAAD
jgi:hypothetical protein